MRRFILAACAALAFGLFGHLSVAEASSTCVGSQSACEAARTAATAGPYAGKRAPTTEPMVCLYALHTGPTELVLADGPRPTGPAILRWRPSSIAWKRWSHDPRLVVGEICIPVRLIKGRSAVTLCNGTTYGEGNHSTWRSNHIHQLLSQRRIPSHDPACLLGKGPCAKYGL